jgi:hypothetical protein
MADVFTVLAKDHEEVKGMLAELEKGPTRAAGAGRGQDGVHRAPGSGHARLPVGAAGRDQ